MGPRNIAGPTVRDEDFWGREGECLSAWQLLETGSVLLTAPRRYGKSSLMTALSDKPKKDWAVIHLDVEYIVTPSEFVTELTASLIKHPAFRSVLDRIKSAPSSLVKWITGALEDVSVGSAGLGEIKVRLRQAPSKAEWSDLASELLVQLRGLETPVLLILDEFPMMIANFLDEDERLGLNFLKWFRAQRQSPETAHVRLLLGGSVNLEPRLEVLRAEALINDLHRLRLRPLSTERAIAFVREVLKTESAVLEADVPEQIVAVAGTGVPFFLQVLIAECLSEARHRGIARIDGKLVKAAYDERVLGPPSRSRFSHYQSRLREHYKTLEQSARIVLASLAEKERLSVTALQEELRVNGCDPDSIDRLIAMLESDYYLIRDRDVVCFESGFLKDWWLRNVPAPRRIA